MDDMIIDYRRENMAESFRLAVLLTLTGGFQDAYSYFARGGVFANAQTGNVVLLAKQLVTGNLEGTIKYLIPIGAFFIGVFVAVFIEEKLADKLKFNWRQMILGFQILIVIFCGFMPEKYNSIVNALLSLSCSMQITAFKKIKGLSTNTAMCVGNIRNASDHLARFLFLKERGFFKNAIHYYTIIFVFAIGAAFGYTCVSKFSLRGVWGALISLIIAFILFFLEIDEDEREEDIEEDIKEGKLFK